MSKGAYTVVYGNTRNNRAAYAVMSGLTRKIKSGYCVREGVYRQFFNAGTKISFSGWYSRQSVLKDDREYNLYTFVRSGVLTIEGNKVDVWLCGSGAGGSGAPSYYAGGKGGGGGYALTGVLPPGTYNVSIGAGGAADSPGSATTVWQGAEAKLTANGAEDENGGSGGGGGGADMFYGSSDQYRKGGTGDGISKYPFGIEALKKHCPGGGGGALYQESSGSTDTRNGANGGENGGNGFDSTDAAGSSVPRGGTGGEYGGGHGDDQWYNTEVDGTFYGSGAGGGYAKYIGSGNSSNMKGPGGVGYQGVMYALVPKDTDVSEEPDIGLAITGSPSAMRYVTINGTKYTTTQELSFASGTQVTVTIDDGKIYENGTVVAQKQPEAGGAMITYTFVLSVPTSIQLKSGAAYIVY